MLRHARGCNILCRAVAIASTRMPAAPKTDHRAILKSSLHLLRTSGPALLSLRAVAADLGIAPNAIYHHFPNRNALDHALAEEAARRIRQRAERALRNASPPAALHCFALAYLRFAAQQPALYDMLLTTANESCSDGERRRLWALLLHVVASHASAHEVPQAATSIWSLLHGAVTLSRAGMLGTATPRQAVAFGLSALTKKER